MSELVRLIDSYRDAHGRPSDASVARALGIAPQTLASWRKRGIRQPPESATLRALAGLVRLPYESYVLQLALYDAGWRDTLPSLPDEPGAEARGA